MYHIFLIAQPLNKFFITEIFLQLQVFERKCKYIGPFGIWLSICTFNYVLIAGCLLEIPKLNNFSHISPMTGMGFCGFFRICRFLYNCIIQCFQSSAFLQFLAFRTLIREREMREKNAYKITLIEPQREMRKTAHKNIPKRASSPPSLDCERHAQCTVSFCLLLVF